MAQRNVHVVVGLVSVCQKTRTIARLAVDKAVSRYCNPPGSAPAVLVMGWIRTAWTLRAWLALGAVGRFTGADSRVVSPIEPDCAKWNYVVTRFSCQWKCAVADGAACVCGDCYKLFGPSDFALGHQGDSDRHSHQQSNQSISRFDVSCDLRLDVCRRWLATRSAGNATRLSAHHDFLVARLR